MPIPKKAKMILILTALLFSAIINPSHFKDSDNLYDVCPADTAAPLRRGVFFFNGLPCKDPLNVTASDFKSSVLAAAGDTGGFYRSSTVSATAAELPGLNTLGLSAARTDIEVDGVVMPHAHPRATEMAFVRTGLVVAGFVDSRDQVFQKRLQVGDVFVFPKGLLHFWFNAGFETATMFSVFNSQSPGLASVTGTLFAMDGLDARKRVIERLRSLRGDLNGMSGLDLLGK